MVGVLDNVKDKMTMDFKKEGDAIYLVGAIKNDINSSEYLHKLHGVEHSPAPYFNLDEEFVLQQAILKLIKNKQIVSAHDISEGGLFLTLTESSFNRNLGYAVETDSSIRKDAYLFGEAQSRVVVSVDRSNEANVESTLKAADVPFKKIGAVTKGDIKIDNTSWGSIKDWKQKYDCAIENLLKGEVAEGALSTL
jgi:phosphoribosylformylglycinamidine (FGAM) synthase-like enzyme